MNERLPGGDGVQAYVAKTTPGEVLRLWGYFLGACTLPEETWDTLWRKKPHGVRVANLIVLASAFAAATVSHARPHSALTSASLPD